MDIMAERRTTALDSARAANNKLPAERTHSRSLHRDLSAFAFLGFNARRFIVAVTKVLNFVLVPAPAARSSFEILCPACSREPA
jgi:hypothetical protein